MTFRGSNQFSDELKLWNINMASEKVKGRDGELGRGCGLRCRKGLKIRESEKKNGCLDKAFNIAIRPAVRQNVKSIPL